MRCSPGSPSIAPSRAHGRGKPGCGSGQASRGLARAFDRVHATDPSAAQIAQARGPGERHFRGRAGRALQPGRCQRRCGLRRAGAALVRSRRVLRRMRARAASPAACWSRGVTRTSKCRAALPAANAALQDEIRDVLAAGARPDRRGLCRFRLAVRPRSTRRSSSCARMDAAAPARIFLQLFGHQALSRSHRTRSRRGARAGVRGRPGAIRTRRGPCAGRCSCTRGARTPDVHRPDRRRRPTGRARNARRRRAPAHRRGHACRSTTCSWAKASRSTACA